MTNRLALTLAFLIVGFFALDAYVLNLGAGVFLGRKFLDLLQYMAFWR